ncbi:hypothetical protein [Methylobacterium sp. Leaf93]|nr:hypothetical protein [Methylobacterium sp. Leaf93]
MLLNPRLRLAAMSRSEATEIADGEAAARDVARAWSKIRGASPLSAA